MPQNCRSGSPSPSFVSVRLIWDDRRARMLTGRATGRQKCLTVYLLTGHPVCPGKYRFFQGILNEIKVTSYLRICWFVYRYYLYHSSHFVRFHFPEYGLRIGSGSSAEEVLCQIHRVAQPGQKSEEKWLPRQELENNRQAENDKFLVSSLDFSSHFLFCFAFVRINDTVGVETWVLSRVLMSSWLLQ